MREKIHFVPFYAEHMSLVPDETLALVGHLLAPPVTVTITERDAQRYAHACDDLNPLYFDPEAARAQGHRALCVPPTFVQHAMVPTRPLADLRIDGLFRASSSPDVRPVRLNVARTMAAGDEWDWLEQIYVGDTITAETRLKSVKEKAGSKGVFVLTRTETTFTRDGQVVARLVNAGIAR